jgi:UDP-xylose/UDP-N-acetylglucosamine transporter B4
MQVASVLIITTGVGLTTTVKSSSKEGPKASSISEQTLPVEPGQYATGIGILTLALILSSAMGLAQDATYTEYGRGHWEEGMFYLHFLSMPMFAFLKDDMAAQVAEIRSGESMCLRDLVSNNTLAIPLPTVTLSKPLSTIIDTISTVTIPTFYFPLLINVLTQLLCVSGVHRLTSRVSSLTVTLVLTVRKAVSLIISVVILGGGRGDPWLWLGAGLVLAGTVLYTLGSTKPTASHDTTSSKKTL